MVWKKTSSCFRKPKHHKTVRAISPLAQAPGKILLNYITDHLFNYIPIMKIQQKNAHWSQEVPCWGIHRFSVEALILTPQSRGSHVNVPSTESHQVYKPHIQASCPEVDGQHKVKSVIFLEVLLSHNSLSRQFLTLQVFCLYIILSIFCFHGIFWVNVCVPDLYVFLVFLLRLFFLLVCLFCPILIYLDLFHFIILNICFPKWRGEKWCGFG